MTHAELIHLLEEITGGNTVADVRSGSILLRSAEVLDDAAYGTMIDFIRGDRPAAWPEIRPTVPGPAYGVGIVIDEAPAEREKRDWAELGIDPQAPGLTPEELAEEQRFLRATVAKFDMSGISLPTTQG